MEHYHTIESLSIEEGEQGFEMRVIAEEETFVFFIQYHAESLYDQCRSRIGPYLRERDEARGTWVYQSGADRAEFVESGAGRGSHLRASVRGNPAPFHCDPCESGGYDISEPKHPDHHSVHADIYDQRASK